MAAALGLDLVVEQPAIRRLAIDPLLVNRERMVVLDAHVELARPGADGGARLAVRPYPRELEQTATLRDGHERIKEYGFSRSPDESCVYVKASGSVVVFPILYVDDILLI